MGNDKLTALFPAVSYSKSLWKFMTNYGNPHETLENQYSQSLSNCQEK